MADGACTLPGAVIFDCDGVLVDSEPISLALLLADLDRHGLKVVPSDAGRLFLGGTIQGVADTARGMGADLPEDWVADFYSRLYARLREGVPPIFGATALLDRLDAAGVPFAVASNGSLEKMDITLGQTGMRHRFEGRMLSAHAEGVAKPDPGLFLRAAARLGVAPEACVVVGDSPADAQAARAAGMRCLGLAPEDDGARLAAEGAEVVHSLDEAGREIGL